MTGTDAVDVLNLPRKGGEAVIDAPASDEIVIDPSVIVFTSSDAAEGGIETVRQFESFRLSTAQLPPERD